MVRTWSVLCGAQLLASPVFAGDAARIAATLKDEAAECRYLLTRCEKARRAAAGNSPRQFQRLQDAFEAAKVIEGKHGRRLKCFDACAVSGGK